MPQCVNVNICNFTNFGLIFRKFSRNCRAKEMGVLFTILGSFSRFWIRKGRIFVLKIGLGKSPELVKTDG